MVTIKAAGKSALSARITLMSAFVHGETVNAGSSVVTNHSVSETLLLTEEFCHLSDIGAGARLAISGAVNAKR